MRALTIGLFGVLIALSARSHDFWIEPSSFAPAPGQDIAVRLRVGEHFNGDPVARPAELNHFVLVDAQSGARSVLPGRTGVDPANRCTSTSAVRSPFRIRSGSCFVARVKAHWTASNSDDFPTPFIATRNVVPDSICSSTSR